jgi:hypothetical protein
MKKVIVCGDSWMTPSIDYPNTHFSERLANRLNWKLEIYARGGMSNNGICLQIESAIKENPDFILLDTAPNDRIELPIGKHCVDGQKNFDVRDIVYNHPQSTSSLNPNFNKSPRLIIDTIYSFLDHSYNFAKYKTLVPDLDLKRAIIKQWFNSIYNDEWKLKTDKWCLYAALHQLHNSKIPYLIVIDPIQAVDICPWIDEKTYLHQKIFNDISRFNCDLVKAVGQVDPGYHTLPEAQHKIADLVLAHLEVYARQLF